MKSINLSTLFIFLFMLISFTSCDIALGIFEAGVWVGIIIVILVIVLIVWLIKKFLT